jgi:uncharacterized membrane protein
MKQTLVAAGVAAIVLSVFPMVKLKAQPAADPLIEGFRLVEVASVSDAMEQLYKQRA